ncbi:galactokinase family protein [Paenibacillus shenyangensis]|uniref:galactokinase family protein n=1 Tax=Paenibacillus sp. A9 TaxID=1284352 RepID=UPI00037DA149|nr:galactokinase family protein [Paenibacillus sp. A9]
MSTLEQTQQYMRQAGMQQLLTGLYGQDELEMQQSRYEQMIGNFLNHYGVDTNGLQLFSASGRVEIGGNHTDHNHGKVLAGSIHLDTIAAAVPTSEPVIVLVSEGYEGEFKVNLDESDVSDSESATTKLLRGIVSGFREKGLEVGGFRAYVTTNVLAASGLSSSASFEMLICTILNHFYNKGTLGAADISKIGQYAENQYWNKPSGLLDQMACAYGGMVAMDFADPSQPQVEQLQYDFQAAGYSMMVVNTGGNHADLTEDYASVPNEMFAVAHALGAEFCRDITLEQIYAELPRLRQETGDRAILRAMHFLEENRRVDHQVEALRQDDMPAFLRLLTASGNSSWKWLQNCYRDSDHHDQSMAIALAITEIYLQDIGGGACRLHGGGFAGVILAVIPNEHAAGYRALIEKTLGTSIFDIRIREKGAFCLNALL